MTALLALAHAPFIEFLFALAVCVITVVWVVER